MLPVVALLAGLLLSVRAQLGQDVSWGLVDGQVPSPRHEHCAVSLGGQSYLIGGRGIKPVDEYDGATGIWSPKKEPSFDAEINHMQP